MDAKASVLCRAYMLRTVTDFHEYLFGYFLFSCFLPTAMAPTVGSSVGAVDVLVHARILIPTYSCTSKFIVTGSVLYQFLCVLRKIYAVFFVMVCSDFGVSASTADRVRAKLENWISETTLDR